MKLNGVILWPSSELEQVSEETTIDDAEPWLDQMWKIIEKAPGVGLAAVQIGVPIRLFLMDCRNEHKTKYAFMNPEIVELVGDPVEVEEGCLSVPGFYEKVMRYPQIVIRATNIEKGKDPWNSYYGESRLWYLYGLEAQCAAHEIEHLDGKIFLDNIGPVKRDIVKRKMKKFMKSGK